MMKQVAYNFLLLCLIRQAVAAQRTSTPLEAVEMLLDPLNILETQLRLDDLHVTDGVDVALDVNDLSIVETPNDLEDGIDSADV